jgi:hypothetical protein
MHWLPASQIETWSWPAGCSGPSPDTGQGPTWQPGVTQAIHHLAAASGASSCQRLVTPSLADDQAAVPAAIGFLLTKQASRSVEHCSVAMLRPHHSASRDECAGCRPSVLPSAIDVGGRPVCRGGQCAPACPHAAPAARPRQRLSNEWNGAGPGQGNLLVSGSSSWVRIWREATARL